MKALFIGMISLKKYLSVDINFYPKPSFIEAARPEQAKEFYDEFNYKLRKENIKVETGIFGAVMDVSHINDGPVTIIINSTIR